ncbi:MAG: hypothetical protein FWF78_05075 [Defluviitaleaceae bacterium]|nr:hypothetical protein [Defluviitaleaceae bacterium]
MVESRKCLVDSMIRHIGQTVTIFTTSGGLSGNGFSGVLLSADCDCVRLLADIGAPPACVGGSKVKYSPKNEEIQGLERFRPKHLPAFLNLNKMQLKHTPVYRGYIV